MQGCMDDLQGWTASCAIIPGPMPEVRDERGSQDMLSMVLHCLSRRQSLRDADVTFSGSPSICLLAATGQGLTGPFV